jgi:ATP-binding cassette, subfamily B, bacterial MsbA
MSSSYKVLLGFAKKYPILIVLIILLGFSGALFNGISTALVIPLLLAFLGEDLTNFNVRSPMLQKVFSWFDVFPQNLQLIAMFVAVLSAIILKNAANYSNTIVAGYFSKNLTNSMRLEGIKLLLDVDLDFYSKWKMGDIVNRISQEINRAAGAVKTLINIVSLLITITVFVFALISLSWQLTLVAIFLLSLVAWSNQIFSKRAKEFGRILSERAKAFTNKFLEILSGMRLVKTVATEESEYQIIKKLILEKEKDELDSQANFAIVGPINEVLGIIAIFLLTIIAKTILGDTTKDFATVLLTYLVFLFRLLPVVGQLNGARNSLANTSSSVKIATEFLNRNNKPFMVNGSVPYQKMEQGIYFEGVKFSYPEHKTVVLKGIDLWIPKGKTVALVGASGAGKSTIADLLPRFYDPTDGRITIDGKDLKEYNIKSLRDHMGIVSQDTFLFNNTIRYNIAYGYKDVSDEAIIEAAKRANAYEFIQKLEQGLDTEVGDRGVMLSGGQKQRMAIARALLRDPDILILDEATSALDTVSERLVQKAIEELCRDRTTLVIAHRLSTVQKAHKIIVLEKGKVVEQGTHEELLARNGYYSRLYTMQFSDKPQISIPQNEALIRASLRANYELRHRFSYQLRSRLNTMLGSLRLVNDGLIDSPDEQNELIQESLDAALEILADLESFEGHKVSLPI